MECIRVLTEKIVLVKALLPESFNWFGSTLDNTLETVYHLLKFLSGLILTSATFPLR